MKTNWVAAGAVIVFLLGLSLLMAISGVQAIATLATIPIVVGLVGGLFLFVREMIAHDRTVLLQEGGHRFSMGATSHMAEVAFDKHVAFCEEYTDAAHHIAYELAVNGPTKDALTHSGTLGDIRTKHALWLTAEIDEKLSVFEYSVRMIGVEAQLLDGLTPGPSPERSKAVDRMYKRYADVMGLKDWSQHSGEPTNPDLAISVTIQKLQQILGIDALTALRNELTKRAIENATR